MDELDQIMQGFYQCHLKKNANKHFIKWLEKQSKDKIKPQLETLVNER